MASCQGSYIQPLTDARLTIAFQHRVRRLQTGLVPKVTYWQRSHGFLADLCLKSSLEPDDAPGVANSYSIQQASWQRTAAYQCSFFFMLKGASQSQAPESNSMRAWKLFLCCLHVGTQRASAQDERHRDPVAFTKVDPESTWDQQGAIHNKMHVLRDWRHPRIINKGFRIPGFPQLAMIGFPCVGLLAVGDDFLEILFCLLCVGVCFGPFPRGAKQIV